MFLAGRTYICTITKMYVVQVLYLCALSIYICATLY